MNQRPPSNLVFLLDVSGSMMPPEQAAAGEKALKLLVERLSENDRVAIVVYAGDSRPGAAVDDRQTRRSRSSARSTGWKPAARPTASGRDSTGVPGAPRTLRPRRHQSRDPLHRRRLQRRHHEPAATWSRLIEGEAKSGVFLTVLGFGMGNLKDATLETTRRQGQRQLRLHRLLRPKPARCSSSRWAARSMTDRQGREDPGRVQSRPG